MKRIMLAGALMAAALAGSASAQGFGQYTPPPNQFTPPLGWQPGQFQPPVPQQPTQFVPWPNQAPPMPPTITCQHYGNMTVCN